LCFTEVNHLYFKINFVVNPQKTESHSLYICQIQNFIYLYSINRRNNINNSGYEKNMLHRLTILHIQHAKSQHVLVS